jgi:AcrR family transcriptional regulator
VVASPDERPAAGLRERKKARTRAAIQRQALRLFGAQGYDETTVQQIADAAEVSESTFFRYFPSKEDVVLWDEFDPPVIDAFLAQPQEIRPVQALRAALRTVLGELPADVLAIQRERVALVLSVPPLRAMLVDQMGGPMRLLADALARRTGRRPDDPAIRVSAGALMGVGLSAMFAAAEDPAADLVDLFDEGLALLEAGLPL